MAVYRAYLYGSIAGQMTCNVMHFWKGDAVSADHALLATKINEGWAAFCGFNVLSAQSWNRVHIIRLDSSPHVAADYPFSRTGSWATTTEYSPVMCFVLQFKTSFFGRHGMGKYYQSGVQFNWMNVGNWNATTQTRLNNLCTTLKGIWTGASPSSTFNLVVCPRNDPTGFHFVTDIVCRPMAGVQRRRNIGVGA